MSRIISNILCRQRFGAVLAMAAIVWVSTMTSAERTAIASKSKQNSQGPQEKSERLPARLTLGNGQSITVSEILPRCEASLSQVTLVLGAIRNPSLQELASSLDSLKITVTESEEQTERAVNIANSPIHFAEIEATWERYESELEAMSSELERDSKTLTDNEQQLHAISTTWTGVADSAGAENVPSEIVQRIENVLNETSQAESELQHRAEELLKLQVQVSQLRTQIQQVGKRIKSGERELQDKILVMDSPPLWRSLTEFNFNEEWHQSGALIGDVFSRWGTFAASHKSRFLLYAILSGAILLFLSRLARQDRSSWSDEKITARRLLDHPIWLGIFISTVLFALVFTDAPIECKAIARVLMSIPSIFLAVHLTDVRLRRSLVAIGAFYVFNVMSLQLLGGPVLRRISILLLALALLTGLLNRLQRGSDFRNVFSERRRAFIVGAILVASSFLSISIVCNLVGNASLADVLASGTIRTTYFALVTYVLFISAAAIAYAIIVSDFGQKSRAVRLHCDQVNAVVVRYLKLSCWALWVVIAMTLFNLYADFLIGLQELLHKKWQFGTVSISAFDLILFGLVLYISLILARLIRFFLNEEVFPRTSVDFGAGQAASRLAYIVALTLGFFLALGAAGVELSRLTFLTGAFGVGLGFGLQNIVSNLVSGVIVSLERPVKVGNLVEVGDLNGEVRDIGFRASTVRTADGADVIVPNSEFITKSVVNWSLTDLDRRTDIQIGTAYGTDPERVIEILGEIVDSHPEVKKDPAPLITFDQFGDSALLFTVRFWTKIDPRIQIRSDLNIRICREFKNNGIEIPFPQRDLHLRLEETTPALSFYSHERSAQ